jgi:hypothetical protein
VTKSLYAKCCMPQTTRKTARKTAPSGSNLPIPRTRAERGQHTRRHRRHAEEGSTEGGWILQGCSLEKRQSGPADG